MSDDRDQHGGRDGDAAAAARRDPRPRPRYGEYAPEGWVNPVPPADAAPPAGQGEPVPTGQQPTSWSQHPQQGQGAGGAQPYQGPPTSAPVLSTGRRVDRVATFVLLGLAGYNVISNIVLVSGFSRTLLSAFSAQGYPVDDFTGQAALQQAGGAIAIVSLVVFVPMIVLTVRRLRAGKVTFWVPLAAGAVVTIVQMVLVLSVFLGDAAFVQSLLDSARPTS
ncbi:DUF6264 family protein [Frigoribacterium sp. PvP032]|uniref:DUF6264 family protein n=1 Tax=Frigoribacterium sp. PvP032 TaxID=2806589 RepID=UPI001AE3622C|nr:DUF6264 family protein [Frigoribacterium sp. PvP032]MBP1191473.1 uncharacterized membrane protein YhaH (DUF805 family) [Frigoribacterium sp. PvP032]